MKVNRRQTRALSVQAARPSMLQIGARKFLSATKATTTMTNTSMTHFGRPAFCRAPKMHGNTTHYTDATILSV